MNREITISACLAQDPKEESIYISAAKMAISHLTFGAAKYAVRLIYPVVTNAVADEKGNTDWSKVIKGTALSISMIALLTLRNPNHRTH